MINLNSAGIRVFRTVSFNSMSELTDCAGKVDRDDPKNASTQNEEEEFWDLNTGFEKALKLARDGWREGALKILSAGKSNLSTPTKRPRPQFRNDVSGDLPDVGEYLRNEPLDMKSIYRPRKRPMRFAQIIVHVGGNCNIDGNHMFNKGAAVVSIIDSLESAGIRVELDALEFTQGADGNNYDLWVRVKEAHQTLDLSTVSFAIAHPAMLRRILFAAYEMQGDAYRRGIGAYRTGGPSGYGRSIDLNAKQLPPGVIYVPSSGAADFSTPKGSRQWVREILKPYGIEVEP